MEMPGRENILVVDDEIELREAISAYLSQEGYEVQQASSGVTGRIVQLPARSQCR